MTPCLYGSSSQQHSKILHNTFSFSSTAVSTSYVSWLFFRINKKLGGKEYTSMRKQNKVYFNYCSKVKLYNSNIFLIIFLGTWHRFKFPTTKYFMTIFIEFMKILIIIIDIICDTIGMYLYWSVCKAWTRNTGIFSTSFIVWRITITCTISHYPQSCNLCHPGKMVDCLTSHKVVVQTWSILCGAHCVLVAAEHKCWYLYFNRASFVCRRLQQQELVLCYWWIAVPLEPVLEESL
jgi:hypothetical protein